MTMNAAPTKPLLTIRQKDGKIYSHVRKIWLNETPEERVRQNYLCTLVNLYGYTLAQIQEEATTTGRGTGGARADFLIWRTSQAKADNEHPLIVVECKSDNVTITEKDYQQGENYARYEHAPFFVTHNSRETKYWRLLMEKRPGTREEIANIPEAGDDDKRIAELIDAQKTFNDRDFAKLLHDCHDIIRNREHKDPAAAFDEIAKLLFVKVDFERKMRLGRERENLFSAKYLDDQQRVYADPLVSLFNETKRDYKSDKIFQADDQINLKFNTAREIVLRLEKYNLSDTSEDIKGIAFERFLGRTFRGEIGQFFTPRTIVDFMIEMVDPQEGDVICDPASGSGGFLIRFFDIVREKILADAARQYRDYEDELTAQGLTEEALAPLLLERYEAIQKSLNQRVPGSRLWKLANRCIYGTDANDRMARTSKMNMIMHGDGHGGVHHHNGFLNVNGIFEGRFDIILTNPPFGAFVENSDLIRPEDLELDDEDLRHYQQTYGNAYTEARARVEAKKNNSITSLFTLPKDGKDSKIKTEVLFIERCLDLLRPGGRLGIVLPDSIFNNPSLAYVREFCEDHAFLRAVVSLPQEAFTASGASVKASLLFMQKFTEAEQEDFDTKKATALQETQAKHQPEIDAETARLTSLLAEARAAHNKSLASIFAKELRDYERMMLKKITLEARNLLKVKFPYLIFLYEAEKIGITSTGETGEDVPNELGPKKVLPSGVRQTTLAEYSDFRANPTAFLIDEDLPPANDEEQMVRAQQPRAFAVWFKDASRWDPNSFHEISWHWPTEVMAPLGSVLKIRKEKVSRDDFEFANLQPITIHFDGSIDKRKVDPTRAYTMDLYFAHPGDIVVAKIDLKNGAVGLVPPNWENVVVTSHFAVYEPDLSKVVPQYLLRLIQTRFFKAHLNRNKVGAEGRKEVKLSFFETELIPIPPLSVQQAIVSDWQRAQEQLAAMRALVAKQEADMEGLILGANKIGEN